MDELEAAYAARDAQRRLDAAAPLLLDVVRKAATRRLTRQEAAEAQAIIAFVEGRPVKEWVRVTAVSAL